MRVVRRVANPLVLVAVAAAGAGRVEAAPTGTLTIEGDVSAWTDVVLPAGVTFDLKRATVSGNGRFAGFYVDARVADGRRIGMLSMRDFHAPGDAPEAQPLGTDPPTLPPGAYRIYLIADGRTSVRVPVDGMASRTVRPARVTKAAVAVQRLPVTGVAVSGRQPMTAARRSLSLSTLLLDDVLAFAGTIAVCVTSHGGRCDGDRADGTRLGYYVNPSGPYPFIWTVVYPPGTMAGRLDAVQEAQNVAGVTHAVGASFTLDLA